MENKNIKQICGVILIVSLIANIYLYVSYNNKYSNLEKALVMNDFSNRLREIRNFTNLLQQLTDEKGHIFPISEKEQIIVKSLSDTAPSIVPKVTDKIASTYPPYFSHVDLAYSRVVNEFVRKLPVMNKNQLDDIRKDFDKLYDEFLDISNREFGLSTTGHEKYPQIDFEINDEKLEKVLNHLKSIEQKLIEIK